jgi:hypothetical protein
MNIPTATTINKVATVGEDASTKHLFEKIIISLRGVI